MIDTMTASETKAQKYLREYYQDNKEKILAGQKITYQKYKDAYNEKNRKYQKDNHVTLMQKRKERIESSPLLQFKERIRLLTKGAFYRLKQDKKFRTHTILGADWETVKEHIVSQFVDGMTWEAFTLGDIHIDHIQPLASAKTEDELIALCHYKNLQPLWALDNLKKGATFDGVNYKTKQ
jgi:hemin uptake protein HemP